MLVQDTERALRCFDLKGNSSSGSEILCSGIFEEDDEVLVETSEEEYACVSISSIKEDLKSGKGKSLFGWKQKFNQCKNKT